MELLDYEDIKKACRLCLKHDGIKLPIFGEVGLQRDVAHKINICFALSIYETDPLSKLICHRCLYKLEQNYEFRSDVLSVFQQLKKALNLRRSDPVIDRYLSVAEDEIILIGQSETCPLEKKHKSELTDETVRNNPVQSPGGCLTFSGHSPEDTDEQIEIHKHTPFDDTPAVEDLDVASEVHTGNSSSEQNDLSRRDQSRTTSINDELNSQDYCDSRIEAYKQGLVQNELVGPQNVLETIFRTQPTGKSGNRQRHDGFLKKRALESAEKVDSYWCNFCQKYLKTKKIFRRHNVKVHNVSRSPTYECKCKRKFHSLLEMITHQQIHLKVKINITEDMLQKCHLCGKKFADKSILTSHLTTHSGNLTRKSSFKPCTNKFDIKKLKLGQIEKSIIKTPALPPELYVCDHCWQIFETYSSLSQHINSKNCFVLCNCLSGKKNISKNSSEIMETTVENVSLQNRQISCRVSHSIDQQSDNIASVTSLETSAVHSVTQPDNTIAIINEKTSTHHSQTLFSSLVNQCTLCAKVFSSKKLLKKHQKTHIAPELTDFACTLCNRTFLKRSGLISHLQKHARGESYHCKFCTRIYANKEIFLSHKCLSNKVYPFCDFQFSQYDAECAPHPHGNSLQDNKDLPKALQINVPVTNEAGSVGQPEKPDREHTHQKNKKYNHSKNRKHIKKSISENSRASYASKNENCMKCPFCQHLIKPESMYQHIYENHPDSNNIK